MTLGTLYGIGVGPGDPEWMTVKGARVLAACQNVFVPRASDGADSLALEIARPYLRPDARIRELTFPMTTDEEVLQRHWRQAAQEILEILQAGHDCCFLTLGDALLYSTYIFLLEGLRCLCPEAPVVTIPGITAFSAAAALTGTVVGRKKQTVTIVPASDDLVQLAQALDQGGTVILMKIGRRLQSVLELLERLELLDRTVFVSRAGMPNQQVETDLRRLLGAPLRAGYLSLMIIQARSPEEVREPSPLNQETCE